MLSIAECIGQLQKFSELPKVAEIINLLGLLELTELADEAVETLRSKLQQIINNEENARLKKDGLSLTDAAFSAALAVAHCKPEIEHSLAAPLPNGSLNMSWLSLAHEATRWVSPVVINHGPVLVSLPYPSVSISPSTHSYPVFVDLPGFDDRHYSSSTHSYPVLVDLPGFDDKPDYSSGPNPRLAEIDDLASGFTGMFSSGSVEPEPFYPTNTSLFGYLDKCYSAPAGASFLPDNPGFDDYRTNSFSRFRPHDHHLDPAFISMALSIAVALVAAATRPEDFAEAVRILRGMVDIIISSAPDLEASYRALPSARPMITETDRLIVNPERSLVMSQNMSWLSLAHEATGWVSPGLVHHRFPDNPSPVVGLLPCIFSIPAFVGLTYWSNELDSLPSLSSQHVYNSPLPTLVSDSPLAFLQPNPRLAEIMALASGMMGWFSASVVNAHFESTNNGTMSPSPELLEEVDLYDRVNTRPILSRGYDVNPSYSTSGVTQVILIGDDNDGRADNFPLSFAPNFRAPYSISSYRCDEASPDVAGIFLDNRGYDDYRADRSTVLDIPGSSSVDESEQLLKIITVIGGLLRMAITLGIIDYDTAVRFVRRMEIILNSFTADQPDQRSPYPALPPASSQRWKRIIARDEATGAVEIKYYNKSPTDIFAMNLKMQGNEYTIELIAGHRIGGTDVPPVVTPEHNRNLGSSLRENGMAFFSEHVIQFPNSFNNKFKMALTGTKHNMLKDLWKIFTTVMALEGKDALDDDMKTEIYKFLRFHIPADEHRVGMNSRR